MGCTDNVGRIAWMDSEKMKKVPEKKLLYKGYCNQLECNEDIKKQCKDCEHFTLTESTPKIKAINKLMIIVWILNGVLNTIFVFSGNESSIGMLIALWMAIVVIIINEVSK